MRPDYNTWKIQGQLGLQNETLSQKKRSEGEMINVWKPPSMIDLLISQKLQWSKGKDILDAPDTGGW